MKISLLTVLMILVNVITIAAVSAHEIGNQEDTHTNQVADLASGIAVTFGYGISTLDVDDEGESEQAIASLLRLDKYNASNNYALQYSGLGSVFSILDVFDDFLNCLFSSDDDCDEDSENTTSLSDLSFLYGWRETDKTYSLGISYVKSDNTVKKQDDYSTFGLVGNLRTQLFSIVDGIAHLNLNKEDTFAILFIGYRFD